MASSSSLPSLAIEMVARPDFSNFFFFRLTVFLNTEGRHKGTIIKKCMTFHGVGLMMSLLPRRWWFCEGVWFKRQREIDHNIWKCSAWLSLASFEWNKSDPRFVAMVKLDNNMVVILDIRRPTTPFMVLSKHITRVNAMPWCSQILGDICALLVMMQGPSFGRWWT